MRIFVWAIPLTDSVSVPVAVHIVILHGSYFIPNLLATRAALAAMKAASAAGDHDNTLGDPFSRSVRGWRVRATAGRNRL